jgi:hypothetical protein
MAWHTMSPAERIQLIGLYMEQAGFAQIELIDRSPPNADPLWVVVARKV